MLPDPSLTHSCLACGAPMSATEKFCSGCGANRDLELEAAMVAGPALESARKWILAVGILYLVGAGLFLLVLGKDLAESDRNLLLATNVGLFVIHVGLYYWAKTAPFAAAVSALGLFLTVHVLNALMDPATIASGIIIKIIFLVVLVRAVSAGKTANDIRKRAIPSARVAS